MKVTPKVIAEYRVIKDALAELKKQESAMRIETLEELFDSNFVGTFNTTVGDFAVKGSFKNNYKVNQVEVDQNYDHMTEDEKRCLNFKPTLVLKEYNLLEGSTSILDDCITISPAMPTMVIKELEDE